MPASPIAPFAIDIASTLPNGLQLIDLGTRYFRKAASAAEFVREPVFRAAVLKLVKNADKIIAGMSERVGRGGAEPPGPSESGDETPLEAPEAEEPTEE